MTTRRETVAGRLQVPSDIADYPLEFSQRVLFSDVDSHRHLNNVAICRYFEEGRAELGRSIFAGFNADQATRSRIVLARITIEYLSEGKYPGDISILTGITKIGNSSFSLAQVAMQGEVCISIAESVMVKTSESGVLALVAAEREAMSSLLMR